MALAAFVSRLIRLRLTHPLLHRHRYFTGQILKGTGAKDAFWIGVDGNEMAAEAWHDWHAKALGLVLVGEKIAETDRRGRPLVDDNFLLLLSAHDEEVPFVLPSLPNAQRWESVLDTAHHGGLRSTGRYLAGDHYPLVDRSVALLRQRRRSSPVFSLLRSGLKQITALLT
jgi:glycogen operon protein